MKVFKNTSQFTSDLFHNGPFLERINTPVKVECGWDIPYLSGYSRDGKTVYIDRHLQQFLLVNGKKIDIIDFLVVHEVVEKALIDLFHMHYRRAHHVATHYEYLAAKNHGINWWVYSKFLKEQSKSVYSDKLTNVPRDLDLSAIRNDSEKLLIKDIQRGARINKNTKQQEKIYQLDPSYFVKIENSTETGYTEVEYNEDVDYIKE